MRQWRRRVDLVAVAGRIVATEVAGIAITAVAVVATVTIGTGIAIENEIVIASVDEAVSATNID